MISQSSDKAGQHPRGIWFLESGLDLPTVLPSSVTEQKQPKPQLLRDSPRTASSIDVQSD